MHGARLVARWVALSVTLAAALPPSTANGAHATGPARAEATATCETIRGGVSHGEQFVTRALGDLEFRLRPARPDRPAGWTIQMNPAGDPQRDLVVYATPPYRSSNPRHLSTAYGYDAEQAVAWTPREFRFVTSALDHDAMEDGVQSLIRAHDYADETIVEVRRAMEAIPKGTGVLRILDSAVREADERHPRGHIARLEFEVELCPPRG